jgi:hypothetical protein
VIKRFLLTRHYLVLFIVSLTESMATTPEEDAIIRRRFLTQVSVSKGQPPLKDLVRKWVLAIYSPSKRTPYACN